MFSHVQSWFDMQLLESLEFLFAQLISFHILLVAGNVFLSIYLKNRFIKVKLQNVFHPLAQVSDLPSPGLACLRISLILRLSQL